MEGSRFVNTEGALDELTKQSLWQWVIGILLYLLSENASLRIRIEELEKQSKDLDKKTEKLESRLKQDSTNSNRPPSSNNPYKKKPPKKGEGKPGAKQGHPGHGQELLNPNKTIPVMPKPCECGCSEYSSLTCFHTHQQIELPQIVMEVIHFLLFSGECTNCGKINKATIPEGHETGYGPRLTAFIAEISIGNSRGWVQSLIASVLNIKISRGAIQKCIDRASEAIKPYYEAIARVARKAKVNFIDETPWYQKGILMWLWVMVNNEVAFFMIQTSRSKEAFEALVEKWAGFLVSDGYGVYRNWINKRQSCLAHLIRRAKGLSERGNAELAHFGKRALSELERLIAWAHAPPTKGEAQMWFARMMNLIKTHIDRSDDAGKLARHLEREMGHLWLFMLEDGVEPTNNRAERALRFAVLWRKMMQGTSSDKGDRWVERILSLKETCRLKGRSTFDSLVHAVSCYFQGNEPDVSWIE